ncbi:hypothetical protein BC829DRAFT_415474 [Chytridium lagenaria]|nr:hypothetical protein BC829DRAFT_415474 [Chytridium lagenaria]
MVPPFRRVHVTVENVKDRRIQSRHHCRGGGVLGDHRWTCLEILEIENMYVTFPVFCDMILSVFGRNFPALKKVMLDNGFLEYEKLWDFEEGFFDGMEVKKGLSVCVRFRGRKSPFQGKSSLKLLKFLADAEELEFEEGQPNIFTESEMKEYLRCLQCTKTDMHGFLMRCSEGHQMFIEAMMVKRYLVLVKPYLVRLRDNELERLRKVLKTGRECEDVVVLWKGTLQSLREFLLVSEDVGMKMRRLVFKVPGEMGEPYFCNFLWELVRTQKRIRELRVVGRLRVDIDVIRFLEGMEKRG